MKPIISGRGVSKSYRISQVRKRYRSIGDSLTDIFKMKKNQKKTFWALKDLNFSVNAGECIGIIGKNGAGKSTLLKVLSRITMPTTGSIKVRNRLASLLEVGTGFHPELTGMENIFFNGSILGLKRQEIKKHLDSIIEFSGVENFIETPLKHYSSGMQLRLAFAVAAHLEPEILLIDEVLAVGDGEFQKKCLQKMGEVAREGRTILFVSHDMGAVKQLCSAAWLLDEGQIIYAGEVEETIATYTKMVASSKAAVWVNDIDKNAEVLLEKVEIRNHKNELANSFLASEAIFIKFYIQPHISVKNFSIGFDLLKNGMVVCRSRQLDSSSIDYVVEGEKIIFTSIIPKWLLNRGAYHIRPMMSRHNVKSLSQAFNKDIRLEFTVVADPSRSAYHGNLNLKNQPGPIFPTFQWTTQK